MNRLDSHRDFDDGLESGCDSGEMSAISVLSLEQLLRREFHLEEVHLTPICAGPLSLSWQAQVIYAGQKQVWYVKRHRGKSWRRVQLELQLIDAGGAGPDRLTPPVIALPDGRKILAAENQLFTVQKFVFADPPYYWPLNNWSGAQARAAGRGLRQFHARLNARLPGLSPADFGASILPDFAGQLASTLDALRTDDLRTDDLRIDAEKLLRLSDRSLQAINERAAPLRLVHGDYHPGNVLFKDERIAAIVDYDYVHQESIFYDLGYAVLSFAGCWGKFDWAKQEPHSFWDRALMTAFLNGYNEEALTSAGDLLPPPISFADLQHDVNLAGLLIGQWLLHVYQQQPLARSSIAAPLQDCLFFLHSRL